MLMLSRRGTVEEYKNKGQAYVVPALFIIDGDSTGTLPPLIPPYDGKTQQGLPDHSLRSALPD